MIYGNEITIVVHVKLYVNYILTKLEEKKKKTKRRKLQPKSHSMRFRINPHLKQHAPLEF